MADETTITKLNQIVDLLGALTAGRLKDSVILPGSKAAGCDYLCDCNHSYCACRGSITSRVLEQISYPEFIRIREERMKELREQLEQLEAPDKR